MSAPGKTCPVGASTAPRIPRHAGSRAVARELQRGAEDTRMTQSIAAIAPSAPIRDPESAPRAFEHDTLEQANIWQSDDGASFGDLLDAVNPLHHLPVVSQIYRAVTDDAIGLAPRLIGAAIFGGPLGFLIAGIAAFFEEMSGGSVADHALALLDDRPDGDELATANPAPVEPGQADADVGVEHPTAATATAEIPPANTPATPAWINDKQLSIAPRQAAMMIAAAPSPNAHSNQIRGYPWLDSESKQISRALLRSQRVRVDVLLANLRGYDAVKLPTDGERERDDGEDRRAHSNLPPDDARAAWYSDAMLRALDKYRSDHTAITDGP